MELTEGDVTDYNYIKERIKEIAEVVNIQEIAYDRWNSSQLVIDLVNDGLPMIPFGQGFASMSAPTKELEKIVLAKELNHGGNKVLRWMCSNVAIKTDPAQNLKIDKSKATDKVDGMIALVMALGCYMNGNEPEDNAYDDRGFVFI
jgi:phage terminase large subunit-like protein